MISHNIKNKHPLGKDADFGSSIENEFIVILAFHTTEGNAADDEF